MILLEYEISIFRKDRHGLVIFSRTQIKFFLKSVYIETLAEKFNIIILINIYCMQNEKVDS